MIILVQFLSFYKVELHFRNDLANTLIGESVMIMMVPRNMTLEQVGAAIHLHSTQNELFNDMVRCISSCLKKAGKQKKINIAFM